MNLFRKKPLPETSPAKDNLIFLFTGTDKKKYYGFNKDSDLPLSRFEVQLMYNEHMRLGLMGEEMLMILDRIDTCNAQMITAKEKERPAISAQIGLMTTVARGRMSNTLHHNLVMAMASVWIVREDEDPIIFNKDIHDQKVKFFEAECREGSAFHFFQKTGFAGLPAYTQLSQEEFDELWTNSINNQQTLLSWIENLTLAKLQQR